MIKVENVEVFNFEGAIRGMRNPINSWDKSDSKVCLGGSFDPIGGVHCPGKYCPRIKDDFTSDVFCVGKADLELMKKLYKAGSEHRKYLRQIFVSMDITAPLYWWKEAVTYKIGTTFNSCSTMHTLHKNGIDKSLFSFDGGIELNQYQFEVVDRYIHFLEDLRKTCKSGDKVWRTLVQLLPESFNQKRTVTMNYENVVNIIHQRAGHKLSEWEDFILILKELPYIKEIIEWVLKQ